MVNDTLAVEAPPPDVAVNDPNPVHTVPTAAVRAKRHQKTILTALRSGELTGHQRVPGGTWRIFQEDLDAWIRRPARRRRRKASA